MNRLAVCVPSLCLAFGLQASGQSGTITTVAGTGGSGFSGDGGPAMSAQLNAPAKVAVDAAGNIFIADGFNNRIRKVSATGVITTVAGSGAPGSFVNGVLNYNGGFSGDGGSATSALLSNPSGVAVDAAGNLFIADSYNNRIRKVSPDGIITTVAGSGSFGVIKAGAGYSTTGGYSGDGGPATSALLSNPWSIAVDAAGNLFIADSFNYVIRKVSAGGIITTVAGNRAQTLAGDGGLATAASLIPYDVAVDASGNLFIADAGNNRVRKVSASGIITSVAGSGPSAYAAGGFSGDGGLATSAGLYQPSGVAVDASGNLFIADTQNYRIRKVSSSGIITTVAGSGVFCIGFPPPPSGDGGPATAAAMCPYGVAVDASGDLLIADEGGSRIRKVLALASSGFSLTASPASLTLSVTSGGSSSQQIGIESVGDIPWNATPSVSWIALSPASGTGPGTVSVTIDATSLKPGNYVGSIVISTTLASPPQTVNVNLTVNAAPSVNPGGIGPVFSKLTSIQPGEWVSIYGSGLAGSTVTWDGTFTTSLGGTSVKIDGKPAYLSYVSPGLINLQAPTDRATGSVPVVVTSASGTAFSTVTLAAFAPSFSLLDGTHVAGIILRANGAYDILGPTGNSLGYPTVAAKAGDNIALFAVGLGPTSPEVQAGQAFSGQAPTTNPVTLLIGNMSLTPAFAGLSSAGLYQINLTVPAGLGTGDVPLVATAGGFETPSYVVISLQ